MGWQMRERIAVEDAVKTSPEFISILAGRDAALAEMRRQLQDDQRARDVLASALDTARSEILTLTRTAEAFHAALAQRNQDAKTLRASLAQRDDTFAAQTQQLEAIQQERTALAEALEKDRAEILALTRAVDALRIDRVQCDQAQKASLALCAKRATEAENALAESAVKLAAASALVTQRDAEIFALLSSTSWKLTAPLRKVAHVIARHRPRR